MKYVLLVSLVEVNGTIQPFPSTLLKYAFNYLYMLNLHPKFSFKNVFAFIKNMNVLLLWESEHESFSLMANKLDGAFLLFGRQLG